MKTVAVSGYFDSIHEGHKSLFEEAKKLGDRLVVIVGTDNQLVGKKGFYFHSEAYRSWLVSQFSVVDDVVLSIDEDGTVRKTLEMVKPDIFANGGDRNSENIPESDVCNKLGIEMVFGVGGNFKMNSSSDIIQSGFERYSKTHREERPWGHWKIISQSPGFKIKLLIVEPGKSLSLQSHKHRSEHWIVVKGKAGVIIDQLDFNVLENESCYIPRNHQHQLKNIGSGELVVVEVATGDYIKEDDITRYENKQEEVCQNY